MPFTDPLRVSVTLPDGSVASVTYVQSRGPINLLDRGLTAGDVNDYAANNSSIWEAATTEAAATGHGLYLPGSGTYRFSATLNLDTGVYYSSDGATLRLADAVNVDLMQTRSAASLWSGSTTGGESYWTLRGFILDGNRAGQTGTSYVLTTYGKAFRLEDVRITNGKTGGWRSRWGTNGTDMEAHIYGCKIFNNAGTQLDWQGPHDSIFVNLHVFTDFSFHGGALIAGSKGIVTGGNAAGEQFTNIHVWGFHVEGLHLGQPAQVSNGQVEAAQVNVWLENNRCVYQGAIYGTAGTGPATGTEVGLRVGTSPSTFRGEYTFSGVIWNWAAGDHPIEFAADSGGIIDANVRVGAATATYFGSKSNRTQLRIMSNDNQAMIEAPVLYGAGAPSSTLGVVGSFYHRSDGTTGTRIYHKTAVGTWTAIL